MRNVLIILPALLLVSAAAAQINPAAAPPALFETAPGLAATPLAGRNAGCTALRTVRLKSDVLKDAHLGADVRLATDGADGRDWTVAHVRQPAAGAQIVHMILADDPSALAVFVTQNGVTAMSLRVGSEKLICRLQFVRDDVYEVWRIDPAAFEPESCSHGTPAAPVAPPEVADPLGDDAAFDDLAGADSDGGIAGGSCSSGPIIDTMVVYTPAARSAMGGHGAIRAEAALAVELANVAYANSQNVVRARLVYCDEIAYTESGDMDIDLPRLAGGSDGFMDGIHGLRDSLNGDLVLLYQDMGSGLGYCPETPSDANGFSTVNWRRAAGTFTHAHETGHNIGCGHSREEGDGPCGPSYGLGWRFFGNDGAGYCTVMAYENATYDRILYFSNPNVSYLGAPTGNPGGSPNEAHNARVIVDNDGPVASFEGTRFDIYVNFGYAGLEIGSPVFPFNTIPEGVTAIQVPAVGAAELPNLYVTAGTTAWTGTITKTMKIHACGGTVRIGG